MLDNSSARAPSISVAFEMYRTDFIVMSNQSPKTEEAYINTKQLLVQFIGDVSVSELTFEKVRDWRNWLLGWQSADTARGNIVCVRMVLKFLRKRKYDVLDYEDIPVPKRTKRKIKFLTEDEIEEFIAIVAEPQRGYARINRLRNVAIMRILAVTGLRISELCALDRDSIKNRAFTTIGKSKEDRIGFITEEAKEALQKYLELRHDNDKALFLANQTNKRITPGTVRKIFAGVCDKSRFDNVHPHTMRHSYATHLLEKEVDILYVGDLMGHVDLNTTKIYTHYSNPKLRSIYEKAYN